MVAGSAAISTSASGTTITQTSGRAIINWQDFSVAAGQLAKFVQPDATSATLNRVVSGLPSLLEGSLQANGQVFLINPNGILIGSGARIDAAGFLASTLNVSNAEFLAGGDLHFTGDSTAAVKNLGAINALGGDIFLIARQVENAGSLSAAHGTAGLAAGSEVLLTTGGNERLFVQAAAQPGTVINSGTLAAASAELKAAGGNAYALAINTTGLIRATGTAVRGGQVWLVADGGEVDVGGQVDASSPTGVGGRVVATGGHVLLGSGSRIDASGESGGGEIYVGGGWQGGDAAIANASAVVMQAGATLDASAQASGNGGTAVLWSQDYTSFQANIAATGGRQGGDGGRVETSSHNILEATGQVDAGAAGGAPGQWLLDPSNVTIASSGASGTPYATTFTPSADSVILASSIANSLDAGSDVTITTGTGATAGNITVSAAILPTDPSFAQTLTLSAANTIAINAAITAADSGLHVVLTADSDSSGAGDITFGAAGQISTKYGSFYAGLANGGKQGQNFTMAAGSFVDVLYGGLLNINVNGTVTLAASSLRGTDNSLNSITINAGTIASANAVATVPDIVTTTIVSLTAGTIGSIGTPLKISAGASPYNNSLAITNLSGSSYVNEIQAQPFANVSVTIGSQASSIQNIQIMNDAGGDGTTGTGHVILQTDGAGLLNVAANNIKTAGGGVGLNHASATNVSIKSANMTFATGSVNTGTASFTAEVVGTMSSAQVDASGDISAPTVTFIGPQIGTVASPLELGTGTNLNVNNTGGSTYIRSVGNAYTNIFLTNVKTAGTHSILFSAGDHIDYATNGSAVAVPTITGSPSDGVTFGATTGIDVTRSNRNVTLTANSGDIIFDDNAVNTRAGKFTTQISLFNDSGVIAALHTYIPAAPVAQITAGDVEFDVSNGGAAGASTIGAGGKDIQIAQGAGTSNKTLTVNTRQGNVTMHELTLHHFKTLNVTLNDPSAAQTVAIDLNGADDVNFSDSGTQVSLDATSVNLSENNRNWNLSTPGRTVQIESTSLGSGSYTVTAGKGLRLDGDVLTNGGAIALTSDDANTDYASTGIDLLRSVRIDSNADDAGNTASTGAAGAITLTGSLMGIGAGRILTVDSSTSTATTVGGQIILNSGANDRNYIGVAAPGSPDQFIGAFLAGVTVTAKGSTSTNDDTKDGDVYLNNYGLQYYLNGNFSAAGKIHAAPYTIIDTEQGNVAAGGNITFGGFGPVDGSTSILDTSTGHAGSNGGNVSLYDPASTSHATFSLTEISVTTSGGAGGTAGSIALPAVTTSYPGAYGLGTQTYTGGIITLNGNLTSNEGAIQLTGDTRLAANIVIDTWQFQNSLETGTAGSVTFGGTGVSALTTGRTLTIDTSTNTSTGYLVDGIVPASLTPFSDSGGSVSLIAGNAGGAYVDTLSVTTTAAGTHNVGATNGTIALSTVGTEGAQTYAGGATTVSGALTSNGGNIGLGGVASITLSGAAVTFDTDRTGGSTAAGALTLGSNALNGATALTIDTTADGGGAGTDLTVAHLGDTTPLSSVNIAAKALTVSTGGVTASGAITLEARGAAADLTLNAAVTNTTGNIVLVAGQNFSNTVGAGVLNPGGGRWLVYSTSPAGSTENGLTGAAGSTQPRLYNKTFAGNAPGTIAGGNHLIYSTQPSLTVTAVGQTRDYGDANGAFSSGITGYVSDDGVTDNATTAGVTGAAAIASLATATSPVSGSPYAITPTLNTLASTAGYAFSFVAGALTVSPRPVTVTADAGQTKVYGNADPASFTFGTTSLGSGAALSGGLSRNAGETVLGGPYAITQGTLTNTNNPNYSLTYVGANFAITARPVTVTADSAQTKVYGNADPASFTFTTSSLGTGVALSGALSRAAGETVLGGPYAITQGTVTTANNSNYTVSYVGDTFAITARPVTVTADSGQTKVYGNADPSSFTFTTSSLGTGIALSGALSRTAGETVLGGPYAITQGTVTTGNNSNYTVSYVGDAFAITARPVTVTATAGQSKVYGQSDPGSFAFTTTSLGTGIALSGSLARAVGENVADGPFAITQGTVTNTNNPNYSLTYAGATFAITPASLTYVATAATRNIGASDPTFSGTVTGFISGESQGTATTGTLAFATTATGASPAGTYPLNGSGLTANHGNYTFIQAAGNATAFTIGNSTPLTITADNQSQIYGAALPTFTASFAGFINGDTSSNVTGLQFSTTASIGSNVGTYTITPFGASAPSYYLIGYVPGTLTINPAQLTYTATAASRTYGAANPAFSGTVGGWVNGDTLAGATTGALAFGSTATAASNVGSYAIAGSGLTANHGNYTFTQAAGNATALTINPATLTYAATPASRYVGASDPVFGGTVTGFVNGESASTATTGTLAFGTTAISVSPAGSYPITGSGLTANLGNYSFIQAPGNATALTIGALLALTITAEDKSKTYGAALPSFTATYAGLIGGDTTASITGLQFSTTATVGSNVGTYIITPFGATAPAYYTIGYVAGTLTINPGQLTYAATSASRLYGANNPTFGGAVTGFVNGDTLAGATTGTLAFGSTATAVSDVGTYALTGSGLTASHGNYTFTQASANATAFTITPATLTYVATSASRIYGSGNPAFGGAVTGLVNDQTLTVATTGTLAFSSPAAAGSDVGSYAITGSGLTATHGNYVFAQAAANATALTITPAMLTYLANAASRTYGSVNPVFDGTVTGFVNGDTVAGATTGTLAFGSAATASNDVGAYAILGSGLTANHGNYLFTQAASNATALAVNPATLTVTAASFTRTLGQADPIFTAAVSGFVNSDTASLLAGLTFAVPAAAANATGDYAIIPQGAHAANYSISYVSGVLHVTAPTVSVNDQPMPVITLNHQAVATPELAVVIFGSRYVLVPLGPQPGVDDSLDAELNITLGDIDSLHTGTGSVLTLGSADGVAGQGAFSALSGLNLSGYEIIATLGGADGEGGLGESDPLASTRLNEAGLFRESAVNMGRFNVVYHEVVDLARQLAHDNTIVSTSYSEFLETEKPQVILLRAVPGHKSSSPTPDQGSDKPGST